MNLGKKIYYDILTGNIIFIIREMHGYVRETSQEEDFATYAVLVERVPETVGCLQLDYGQYAQDFAECNGYRVNPTTLELEFSYPDRSEPEPEDPIYHKPLSVEMDELKQSYIEIKQTIAELTMMNAAPLV